jgi:hypothetical protein
MLHTHVASKIEDMNEKIDAHAYEMQCNYESQTPGVLQYKPQHHGIPQKKHRSAPSIG